ncbi:hypothetical protein [Medusavirus stheno T3]|uniref:Uncharacterized protein n=1 Tax=Medusavirus stheno T3 TaxID=3069717 RepID=A0A7S7YEK1_9VIRU|nr:hypothetical protein QKU73_gp421 [Acanthamoeba castellanii medusavirus]QPB44354.1 hypothetical protein [Medusavirus stheno T3]
MELISRTPPDVTEKDYETLPPHPPPLPLINPGILISTQDLLIIERAFNAHVAQALMATLEKRRPDAAALQVGVLVPPSSKEGKAGFAWIYLMGGPSPAPYGVLVPDYEPFEHPYQTFDRDETHAALAWAAASGAFACRYHQSDPDNDEWFEHAWLTRMARSAIADDGPASPGIAWRLASFLRERLDSGPLSPFPVSLPMSAGEGRIGDLIIRIKRFPDQCEHSTDWATAAWRRYERLLAELEAKANSAGAPYSCVE